EGDVQYPWKTAALVLLDDPFIGAAVREKISGEDLSLLEEKVKAARLDFGGSLAHSILDQRGRWVDAIAGSVVRKRRLQLGSSAERFAHLSRHPIYGIPIFAAFLAVTFFMVVHVAGFLEAKLHAHVAAPVTDYLSDLLPTGLWKDFLVGHYGILTLGLFNALCTVLPILATFFLVMSFFEDTGYIPNLCVLSRRVFGKLGLSGKSVMSLILAFGCRTMATLTTRGLTTFKEKFIANYLIAFTVPCGAQLALQIGILGRVGVFAFLFTFGTMILSLFVVGMALNKIIRDEATEDYIQELPPARVPNPRAVLRKTAHRLLWFLKEALPLFLLAAALLFALETSGTLNAMKALLQPIAVDWMGLPRDIVDVLILCLARHEAAAGLLLNLVDSGGLTVAQTIVSVVLITMFVPCFAHIAAMARQMGLKMACLMISCTMTSALVVAGALHYLLAVSIGG
ncbi:MAG TPA: nucleoside recognition domain-containing protein, partial [Sumerlaeia bacterium]|nr:nucleoside recognition domain-containing protein [Sumerlaeia bacterium]